MIQQELTPAQSLIGILLLCIIIAGIVLNIILYRKYRSKPLRWRFLIRRIQSRPWSLYDGAKLFVVFSSLAAIFYITAMFIPREVLHSPVFLLSEIIIMPATALLATWSLINSKQISLREAFGIKWKNCIRNALQGVMCYLAVMPYLLISSIISLSVLTYLGYEIEHQPIIQVLTDPQSPRWLYVTLVISAIVSAPVVEETLFRGIILPLCFKRMSAVSAILFVSLFFAVVHVHIPVIAPIFVLATGLSLGYIATGSLLVPIFAHATFNAVSIIAFMIEAQSLGVLAP
ncbi:hypothetical protein BVX97_04795 [bacterium E08(2017)]|nr:hypothetical protein BVX97_04795 [bacterium E08(2017)]